MFGMNVMAWNGGDLEKLEVLQNRPRQPCRQQDSNPGPSAHKQIRSPVDQAGTPVDQARTAGMRYLVGLDEKCNMTLVDAMKDFLVHAWNE
ncbi:hypothetical protein FHG87_025732 [Trinorchestia longiramus]|nr:hypothetical protein FHG87_025732 [Trinorchestia longiramus]